MALRGLWFSRKIFFIRGVPAVVRDYSDQRIELSIQRLTRNVGAPFPRVLWCGLLALHSAITIQFSENCLF